MDKIYKIKEILQHTNYADLSSITLWGVIVFIGDTREINSRNKAYKTTISIVDDSCVDKDKIVTNVFDAFNDKIISKLGKKGDIIRFHRFALQQFNNQAQGLCSQRASWILFDRNGEDFTFISNKFNPTPLNDDDKSRVTQLRAWLKTNPQLHGLFEAQISTHALAPVVEDVANKSLNLTRSPHLITFSKIPQEGFFDVVCQVCGILECKDISILLVWDGTKTNLNVHYEADTRVKYENFLYIPNVSYYYQIFIFDEFRQEIGVLEAADFVLLKNVQCLKARQLTADVVIKIPGGGQNYGRSITKINENLLDILTDAKTHVE